MNIWKTHEHGYCKQKRIITYIFDVSEKSFIMEETDGPADYTTPPPNRYSSANPSLPTKQTKHCINVMHAFLNELASQRWRKESERPGGRDGTCVGCQELWEGRRGGAWEERRRSIFRLETIILHQHVYLLYTSSLFHCFYNCFVLNTTQTSILQLPLRL